MNMPGFTAETALYQTNSQYRFAVGGAASGLAVLPQQRQAILPSLAPCCRCYWGTPGVIVCHGVCCPSPFE